jgi:hypothetical protein
LESYAHFEQAMSIEAFDFTPHVSGISYERDYKPYVPIPSIAVYLTQFDRCVMDRFMKSAPTDEAEVVRHVQDLEKKLEGYERILAKRKFLAGNVSSVISRELFPCMSKCNFLKRNIRSQTSHISCTATP